MIQFQKGFTTIEQSKKLLELGLPADSADCYYTNSIPHSEREDYYFLHILPHGSISTISSLSEIAKEEGGFVIPCWSVGRLIKIFKICVTNRYEIFEELEMCIDETTVLTQAFKEYSEVIDFSKLEE